MTGPEAYTESLRLARKAADYVGEPSVAHVQAGQLSQTYALLALAAATALGHWTPDGTMPQPDRMDWWQAASGEPAQRERAKDAECRKAATA